MLWPCKSFQSYLPKRQFLVCHNLSKATIGISNTLLNNSGVRLYLDKLISEDYSHIMSKPNVFTLINAIRSLKADLISLYEFDTGQYLSYYNYTIILYTYSNIK